MVDPKKKIGVMIAAGGTGGHLFPGVAIAEAMRNLHPEAHIVFAGTERGLESKVLPRLGWPLVLMRSFSIKDRRGLGRVVAWAGLPLTVAVAVSVLLARRPNLLIGVGGYAAGPLSLAAWMLRIPVAIIEPNAVAGLTNRILGRIASRVFLAFEEASSSFDSSKVIMSGNPVRTEVLSARHETGGGEGPVTILILGGSQGARRLNQAMTGAAVRLKEFAGKVRVLHHAGDRGDVGALERAYADAGIEARVFPFMDRVWEYYVQADMAIARAGASTVAELAALSLPAILIPYPYAADDHQRANAEHVVRLGGARMVIDSDCTGERLAQEIEDVVLNRNHLQDMRSALSRAARPEAARIIVEESWKLIK
jgi:UDP-N-acetylglucosamine--N-acetylmuramyl-(pentapeptide) pyrophosphoryl-undecaprenol N-acetylglucosamine transferase